MIPRALIIICAGVIVGIALGAVLITLDRPLGATITARADHQCEGTEEFTCGPDSLVSALSWVGKTMTEREAVIACGTNRYGTTAQAVAAAAHSATEPLPLSASGRTFIVCLARTYGKNHMVCAHGEPIGWTVNDPAKHDPEHWTGADLSDAVCAIEVRP